jgi:Phage tail assembly chaperone protein
MSQKYAHLDADRFVIGFYDDEWHGDSIPAGAVPISDEQHAALLEGQSVGKVMKIDADGNPALEDPPPPTDEQVAVSVRADRDARLAETDWLLLRHQDETVVGKATTLTADEATTLVDYRQALRDVPTQAGFPHEIDWPQEPGQPG